MSVAYAAIGWNRQKKVYDLTLAGVLLLGLAGFGASVLLFHPATTIETFIIRFTALSALLLLHVILAIGPLARLDHRFLPLLYNRRHLGVTLFLLSAVHGGFAVVQFHALGDANALFSALGSYAADYTSFLSNPRLFGRFPFESLGAGALLIFFLMAATSHDFWLKNLGSSFWKVMHMAVYAAYGLVIGHVALGVLQSERSLLYPVLLGAGFAAITALHLKAWLQERTLDQRRRDAVAEGFEPVAEAADMVDSVGRVVTAGGVRIALYLYKGKLFALSNACRHQGGPLGEGRVVYDCLTCPWHGYQYRLEDGCSPPPFTEIVPTYPVRLIQGRIYVRPAALPLETKSDGVGYDLERGGEGETRNVSGTCNITETSVLPTVAVPAHSEDFYIGWQEASSSLLVGHTRKVVAAMAIAVPFLMALIGWQQNRVDEGTFEFGMTQEFTGILRESPLPMLYVDTKATGNLQSASTPRFAQQNYVLVGAGKFGLPPEARGHDGARVRFVGTLIYRRNMRMIEVTRPETFGIVPEGESPAQAANANASPSAALIRDLGEGTFTGELVDTKCFFGVMRPATGKVHKGCAIRCLSGGAPPGLLLRDGQGNAIVFLLAGTIGNPLRIPPEWAADIITVKGRLELHHDMPVLRAESVERLLKVASEP